MTNIWLRRIVLAPAFAYALLYGLPLIAMTVGFEPGECKEVCRDCFAIWWWDR